MPKLFGHELNWPTFQSPWTSSAPSRNAERIDVGLETLEVLAVPEVTIPVKVFQVGTSFFTVFRSDVHTSERIIHGVQGAIAAVELGLAIALLAEGEKCTDIMGSLCTVAYIFKYIYVGASGSTYVAGEFSKTPYAPAMTTENEDDERDLEKGIIPDDEEEQRDESNIEATL